MTTFDVTLCYINLSVGVWLQVVMLSDELAEARLGAQAQEEQAQATIGELKALAASAQVSKVFTHVITLY